MIALLEPITSAEVHTVRQLILRSVRAERGIGEPSTAEESADGPILLGREHDTAEDGGIIRQRCGGGYRVLKKRVGN